MTENYHLSSLCQMTNIDEDKIFDDLMYFYIVDVRKSLMACFLRVLSPYICNYDVVSEDGSVLWKHTVSSGDMMALCFLSNSNLFGRDYRIGTTTISCSRLNWCQIPLGSLYYFFTTTRTLQDHRFQTGTLCTPVFSPANLLLT